jgi:hypothetical protein
MRQKAKLRLDSFAFAMFGGKHGPVIRPGNAGRSELYRRISLPASSEQVMPPSSKPPLTTDEVTVIRLWIAAGASGVEPVEALKGVPPPVLEAKIPQIDAVEVARRRVALSSTVRQLQTRFPSVVAYESRGSADIQIDAALLGVSFGDSDLAALAPLHDRIVWADLSGTSVSDASASVVGAMSHLRVLRLMNTRVTDKMMQALMSLHALQSLTVMGAPVTQKSLQPLRDEGVRIYDGNEAQDPSGGEPHRQ